MVESVRVFAQCLCCKLSGVRAGMYSNLLSPLDAYYALLDSTSSVMSSATAIRNSKSRLCRAEYPTDEMKGM